MDKNTASEQRLTPIFVVGCERSGTTLLASMLGAHRDIIALPEAQFFTELLPSSPAASINTCHILNSVRGHWRFRIWDFALPEIKFGADELPRVTRYENFVKWFVRRYTESRGKPNVRYWVDHTPRNIQYLARTSKVFPDLKVVHLIRDGRAVASSILRRPWGPNTIDKAATHWSVRVAFGVSAERYLGPQHVLTIRYEDLAANRRRTISRILDFVGAEMDDSVVNSADICLPAYTESQHQLVGQEFDESRIEAWRQELSRRQIEIFESVTSDMLVYYGYDLLFGGSARHVRPLERFYLGAKNVVLRLFNILVLRMKARRYTGRTSRVRL